MSDPDIDTVGVDCTAAPVLNAHRCLPVAASTAYTFASSAPKYSVVCCSLSVGDVSRCAVPVSNAHCLLPIPGAALLSAYSFPSVDVAYVVALSALMLGEASTAP